MPRGFGKTRLEVTVPETWRERFAAKTGTDQNIEATKKAGQVLEVVADEGSYYSKEDLQNIDLICACQKSTGQLVESIIAKINIQRNADNSLFRDYANLCNRWKDAYTKECDRWRDVYIKDTTKLKKANTILLGLVNKLSEVVHTVSSVAEAYKKGMIYYQNENKRLRALLEEHCQGCPASELK